MDYFIGVSNYFFNLRYMIPRKYSVQSKDRRTRVSAQGLLDFPYDCIGLLKTVSTTSGNLQSKTGTGFLVSHFLVLTSASLLTAQSQKYQVEQLFPASFTLVDRISSKRQYKISAFKVDKKYLQIFKEICNLNRNLQRESNPITKKKINEQIMTLNQEKSRHDFALLKLDQRARRAQLLKLMYKMETPSFLTVTGYSSTYKEDAVLMTHSNKIVQIKNGVIYYDIEAKNQQIGSPVYVEDYDNKVLGIHCGFDVKMQLNCAAMITYDFIDILQQWSISMKAPFPFQAINKKQNMDPDDQIYQNQNLFKGEDRRQQVKPSEKNKYPFDCIGQLEGTDRFHKPVNGTGFLISNCFVLTSAHTIYKITNKNQFEVIPLTFEIFGFKQPLQITDYRMNAKFADIQNQIANLLRIKHQLDQITEKVKIRQIQKQINDLSRQQSQYDFALLKVTEKIKRPQYFQIHPDFDHSVDPSLTLTGYDPSGYQSKLLTHSGKFDAIRIGAIFYDIDTTGGQSGSPVYLKDEPTKVVGIHKAGSIQDQLNFCTLITKEVVAVLKKWSIEMNPYFKVIPKSK